MIKIIYRNATKDEWTERGPAGPILLDALNVTVTDEKPPAVRIEIHYREAE